MGAGNAVIGALRVVLGGETVAFEDGLKRADSQLSSFGARMGKAAAAMAAAMVAAGAAIGVSIKGAINEADKLGKMAQSIGIPVEQLSKLKHAADLSGVSIEEVGKSVGKMSRSMSQIAGGGGGGDAAAAFRALGISVTGADGALKSSSVVMAEVADRFARMEDGAGKTAIAMAIFGKAGASMIPLLNSGSAGLKSMMEEAEALGLVIDTKTAKAAEAFNDNLTRLARVKDGIVMIVAARLLPALERMSQALIDGVKNSNFIRTAADGLTRSIMFLVDNVGLLVNAMYLLVGIKVVSIITSFAMSFLALTRAIIAAGVATTLLNAAKTLTIAKVAAFGALVIWATGNLPAFTDALKKVGDAVAQILPSDTGAQIFKGLETLGIDVRSLTGDLSGLRDHADQAAKEMKKVAAPVLSDKNVGKALTDLRFQTQILRGDFALLAEGFPQLAHGLGLFGMRANETRISLEMLTPAQRALNLAQLEFKGVQLTQEMLTPYELYIQKLARIQQLLDAGVISQETFKRAIQSTADAASMSFKAASESIAESFTEIATAFGDSNSDIVKAAKIFGAGVAFINVLVAQSQALTLPFPANFVAMAAIAAKGAALVAAIKGFNAPKMATGGSFMVPGGISGTDNMMVPLNLASGERVTVEPASEVAGGSSRGGFQPISVHIAGREDREWFARQIAGINALTRDGYRLDIKAA